MFWKIRLKLAAFGSIVILFLFCCVFCPSSPPPPALPVIISCGESCLTFQWWLDNYCHKSLLNSSEAQDELSLSEEGDPPGDGLELAHVHLVVRHGDRSPVHPFRMGSPVKYDCGLTEGDWNVSWSGLWDFPGRVSLSYGGESTVSGRLSLHPGSTRKPCGLRKLTKEGFYQLYMLGQEMQSRYFGKLFAEEELTYSALAARKIYAQSTDIPRTIRSAASFLLGFLPDENFRRKVRIHISPGLTLHAPPPGIAAAFSPCKNYKSFLKQELEKSGYFRTEKAVYHPLLEQLSNMFYLEVGSKPIFTHVFDSLLARGCHANSDDILPCYRGNCVDYDFAIKLVKFSNWTFSHAYTEAGSLVGLLPFFRQSVLSLMQEVIAGKMGAKKFVLSTTHDNIMTQILLALGVRLQERMPYASRIAFELWRTKSLKPDKYVVRVLYNGVPVTSRMKAWDGITNRDSSVHSLLPFSQWERFLTTGTYRDRQSYDTACGNHQS